MVGVDIVDYTVADTAVEADIAVAEVVVEGCNYYPFSLSLLIILDYAHILPRGGNDVKHYALREFFRLLNGKGVASFIIGMTVVTFYPNKFHHMGFQQWDKGFP